MARNLNQIGVGVGSILVVMVDGGGAGGYVSHWRGFSLSLRSNPMIPDPVKKAVDEATKVPVDDIPCEPDPVDECCDGDDGAEYGDES